MLQVGRTIATRQSLLGSSRVLGSSTQTLITRTFQSRAHPTKIPEFPVVAALDMIQDDTKVRYAKRAEKWERNKSIRVKKGIEVSKKMCVAGGRKLHTPSIFLNRLSSHVVGIFGWFFPLVRILAPTGISMKRLRWLLI